MSRSVDSDDMGDVRGGVSKVVRTDGIEISKLEM